MSYYKNCVSVSRQEGLCFLVAALLQIEQRLAERRKLSLPQSYTAHKALGGPQLIGKDKIFNTAEVLGAWREWGGRGVKSPLCSTRQAQAKLKSRLQKGGALKNAEVVMHGVLSPVGCWRGAG